MPIILTVESTTIMYFIATFQPTLILIFFHFNFLKELIHIQVIVGQKNLCHHCYHYHNNMKG